MTYAIRPLLGLLGVVSALTLGACADADPASPLAPSQAPAAGVGISSTLLECSAATSVTASDTISFLGGTIQVTDAAGGVHEVSFPAYSVTGPTIFTLTVPASKYVEVRVTAQDLVSGVVFDTFAFPSDAQPTLTISYKRCTRANILHQPLALYHIDEVTDSILEGPFGGKEGNPSDPRVTGKVPHFTDYAIGQP